MPRTPAPVPSYADLDMGVAPGAVDTLRQRRRQRRWRSNLFLVLGLVAMAVTGVVAFRAYENWAADREEATDYGAVCAIDERSLNYAFEVFRGDLGEDPTSLDELVRYGVLSEVPEDWTVAPDPAEPGRSMIVPTPDGRCA